jgi:crossover junction endodeoxyribonuclease RusA
VEFTVTVAGDPIAKGRPRTSKGVTYTPPRTREAEKHFREAAAAGRATGPLPFTVPISVTLQFYCRTRRRVDWDNLAKLATDAMNGLVYTDDVLIEDCRVRVMRGADQPRTEVKVVPI